MKETNVFPYSVILTRTQYIDSLYLKLMTFNCSKALYKKSIFIIYQILYVFYYSPVISILLQKFVFFFVAAPHYLNIKAFYCVLISTRAGL